MGFLSLILVLASAEPDDGLAKKMLPIYRKEVAEYSLAVESAPKKELELKKDPIFEWTNPIRSTLQQGVIFLWLRDGRPAALGSIFSQQDPSLPGRRVIHELHALDSEKILVSRPNALNEWRPRVGLERKELPNAGTPAATPGARLLHMRRLAQEFTGYETDSEGKRSDLRLLPKPLYRYPASKSGVVDGALFTLLSAEGTDPEIWLLIEACQEGGKICWKYACCRFSNRDLYIQHKDKEAWSSVHSATNTVAHDSLHLYRLYADKVVNLEGKLLARVRETPAVWWGESIPVDEK
ncbi:MAG TPA: hypothetical protein VH592_16730 [Gemmataceae bacterium]